MQKEFIDVWQKAHYHGTVESKLYRRDLERLYDKGEAKTNPFDVTAPAKLLKDRTREKGSNIKDFAAKVSEKNKSSVYHKWVITA